MKSVLITGSASGFGRALVTQFLQQGWTVIATLRRLEERRHEFDHEPHIENLILHEMDVTLDHDRQAVRQMIEKRLGGKLDCLINNAGMGVFGPLEGISEKQLRAQFESNFFSAVLLTQALLPALRLARGRVINISSGFGFIGFPLTSVYCASKFALEGLTESLRHELLPHGVQVGLVEPGTFKTSFNKNLSWGDLSHEAYRTQVQSYEKLRVKRAKKLNKDSTPVIQAVLSLATSPRMPLRTQCGSDSRAAYYFKKWLPDSIFDFGMRMATGRIFFGFKEKS